MAIVQAAYAQLIGTGKANEHGSAIGKTPPAILHVKQDGGLAVDVVTVYAAYAAMLEGLMIANTLAGVSIRPSFDAVSGLGAPTSYRIAGSNNDWPEANDYRVANLLLVDANGRNATRFQIPFVDPAETDVTVRAAVVAFLAAYEVMSHGGAGADRLTQVRQVSITSR